MSRKQRISNIIDHLRENLFEREETVAVALLAALAGENVFLLGPPGTAKSLIARRVALAFNIKDDGYFEYLMQKFSTPEEIFGPISIAELKNDNYVRKTERFLPTAKFAFLDEIWKAGPAILNTLLTISNERTFRNGVKVDKVPLKAIISASNETPPENQGLDALYDRFIVRLYVPPLESVDNFHELLKTPATKEKSPDQPIASGEWNKWQNEIKNIKISEDTLQVIKFIRSEIAKLNKKKKAKKIYVSDRRWQKAMTILKAAAYFCDRKETNLVDTLLLRHCLWSTEESHKKIMGIVEKAVRESGFVTENDYGDAKKEKDALETDIDNIWHAENVHKEIDVGGDACFRSSFLVRGRYGEEEVGIYTPLDKIGTNEEFNPYQKDGKKMEKITCDFTGTERAKVTVRNHGDAENIKKKGRTSSWHGYIHVSPTILYSKGQIKIDMTQRIIKNHIFDANDIQKRLGGIRLDIKQKLNKFLKEVETPFILEETREIAVDGARAQLKMIDDEIEECEKWKSKMEEAKKQCPK